MRSTFMGLEASKRGLYTQQSALYTTGHNISNANTEGYTRQRVNMEPTQGYPGMGLNAPKTAGFIGTGVQAGSVQRIRDEFLDRQYRQATNKLSYFETKTNSISQMEDILSEASEFGLEEAFRMLWDGLQDVIDSPEDISARKVAIQRAVNVADSFHYIDTQLKQVQGNLGNEINVTVSDINSILVQIANINHQVQMVEPNGYVPNDLYDERDKLIDELNQYIPVSIERVKSGGLASDVAEGSYKITLNTNLKDPATGLPLEIVLVDGNKYANLEALDTAGNKVDGDEDVDPTNPGLAYFPFNKLVVNKIDGTTQDVKQEDFQVEKGKLLSLINNYGYSTNGTNTSIKGYFPEKMQSIDTLANAFVTAFNEVHKAGYTLGDTDDPTASVSGIAFFVETGTTAKTIQVREEIIKEPKLLAASSEQGKEGNGQWALKLSELLNMPITDGAIVGTVKDAAGVETQVTIPNGLQLNRATFHSYYQGIIGQLGVDGEKAKLDFKSAESNHLTVKNKRESITSVSLDEEMTDMIRFQQAYNANARMITVVDETLDKIINGMGRVGL